MPPAQPPCVTYDPSIHRLNFDFVQCKIVTNNLGGLGYDNKAWVGPPVIRYASVAIGDLKLRTQELLDLFPMDGDRARTIGEFVHYRFDLVLSNLTKYTQNTNRYNGKAKGTFGSVNLKSGFETKFELKLTFSCCLDDECETVLCDAMPGSYCTHSSQPRETYYGCAKMDEAVSAEGIQMEMGLFDMDKDPHCEHVHYGAPASVAHHGPALPGRSPLALPRLALTAGP